MAIVSFRHNFIFIKTTKTAGTSIEIELGRRIAEDDIVTPILPAEPGHRARNFCDSGGTQVFFNHMPAARIRDLIGAERFAGMTRFCVEREPVSKCISHFHMRRNSPFHNPDDTYTLDWEAYCNAGAFPVDVGKYAEVRDGQRHLLVDRILRYDRLETELPALMAELGLPDFVLGARAKSGYSEPVRVTPEQVTADQRRKIQDAFRPSLAILPFEWEPPRGAAQDRAGTNTDRAATRPEHHPDRWSGSDIERKFDPFA